MSKYDVHCDWCGDDYEAGAVNFYRVSNEKHICEFCVQGLLDDLYDYVSELETRLSDQ
jgi:hypothetical protein